MHPDGWQVELELASYGGKVALHKWIQWIASLLNQVKRVILTSCLPAQECAVGLSA